MIIDFEAEGEEGKEDVAIRTMWEGDYVPHVGEHIMVNAKGGKDGIVLPLCWGVVSRIRSSMPPAGPMNVVVTIKRSTKCLQLTRK